MTAPDKRRMTPERRALLDRRLAVERAEQPQSDERRSAPQRRAGIERRLSVLSAEDQIRGALRLLTRVVEAGLIPEQELRSLDAAMLRLRFALDRLEE